MTVLGKGLVIAASAIEGNFITDIEKFHQAREVSRSSCSLLEMYQNRKCLFLTPKNIHKTMFNKLPTAQFMKYYCINAATITSALSKSV